ncbi:MAG: hypothetical protein Q8N39_09490 [Pelolinea sp.]|nr:hypothetical protein [Pelolinea sp.]
MVAINWSFLCDYAFVDEKGRASIIRTFTFIHASRLPIRYPQLYLALEILSGKGETFSLGAVITSPSGKTIAKMEINHKGNGEIEGAVEKSILPIGFYNLQFTEPGEHHIEILVNGTSVHYLPLMILRNENLPREKDLA